MKNPIVIGIANAILPGLGYVFIRRRKTFGILLLASLVSGFVFAVVDPVGAGIDEGFNWLFATNIPGMTFEVLYMLLGMTAFGYDAYVSAKEN